MSAPPDSLTYEQIMRLDEKQIERLFPHGALERKDRWTPAPPDSKSARPLKQLLKDRRKRYEQPQLLARNSTRGYVHDPYEALGIDKDRATRAVPPEPEGVDKEWRERFAAEAQERDQERLATRPLWAELRDIEGKLSPRQAESIRQRIKAARRAA